MAQADRFILYDTAQFSKNDFHNRNRIKTPRGPQWITVPVRSPGLRPIRDIEIDSTQSWPGRIWKTIQANYANAPFFDATAGELRGILLGATWERLLELNERLIRSIAAYLDIATEAIRASSLGPTAAVDSTEQILELTRRAGGTAYLSGPDGPSYLATDRFRTVSLSVMEMPHAEYPQLWGPFVPNLSIIDAVFNVGEGTRDLVRRIGRRDA